MGRGVCLKRQIDTLGHQPLWVPGLVAASLWIPTHQKRPHHHHHHLRTARHLVDVFLNVVGPNDEVAAAVDQHAVSNAFVQKHKLAGPRDDVLR